MFDVLKTSSRRKSVHLDIREYLEYDLEPLDPLPDEEDEDVYSDDPIDIDVNLRMTQNLDIVEDYYGSAPEPKPSNNNPSSEVGYCTIQ